MSSDDPAFCVDPEVETFNEADIEELIGEASSEWQLLLNGVSLSIKQVLREMTRVLTESADLLLLISLDLLDSATFLLDDLLALDDSDLMSMPLLIA